MFLPGGFLILSIKVVLNTIVYVKLTTYTVKTMFNELVYRVKETRLWVVLAAIVTILLCPFCLLLQCGYFESIYRYVGLACFLINVLLVIRYKTFKRFDIALILLVLIWSGATNLYTGAELFDALGNRTLRCWYMVLLFYQIPCILEKEKKERYISAVLFSETISLCAVMSLSMYSSIRTLVDENYTGIKKIGLFVAGRLSTFGNANAAGPACMALIFLSLVTLSRLNKYKCKALVATIMGFCCLVGICSLSLARSRGAMVATAFGMAALFFVLLTKKIQKKKVGAFLISILSFCVFLPILFLPRMVFEKVMAGRTTQEIEAYEVTYAIDTLTDRTLVWPACIRMITQKPERFIYGMTCSDGEGTTILDIYEGRPELILGSAHNTILQQLMFFGIFGLVAISCLYIIWIGKGLKTLFGDENNDAKPFFALGFGVLLFGMVEAIVLPYDFLCSSCISLMILEGYAMSELKTTKKKAIVPISIFAVILVSFVLTFFLYKESKAKIESTYSSIKLEEQKPEEFVRLNNQVSLDMMRSEYWTEKKSDASKVLKQYGEIKKVNDDNKRMITVERAAFSLEDIGTAFYYKTAISLINDTYFNPKKPENLLVNGEPTDSEYWEKQKENLNLDALNERITTRFGFCVTRTTLKRYPSEDKVYEIDDSLFFDQMVQSDIQPFMPVAVLHESLDGEWFYVLAYGYGGWIKKADVALCDTKEEWIERQNPDNYLVVTGRELTLFDNPYCEELSKMTLPMGTIIPIANIGEVPEIIQQRAGYGNYVAKLFYRNQEGKLTDGYVLIPVSEDVNLGYLPYTEENIAKLMFKYLGAVYGWAGDYDSIDCSLYVRQVYRCFGFEMPRATLPQALLECEGNYDVKDMSFEKKKEILESAPIGTLLYFPGHIMMYLGMEEGEPYCISSVGDYSTAELGKGQIAVANTVIITNMLDTTRGTGDSWFDCVERIVVP